MAVRRGTRRREIIPRFEALPRSDEWRLGAGGRKRNYPSASGRPGNEGQPGNDPSATRTRALCRRSPCGHWIPRSGRNWIVGVCPRQHLLHLKFQSRTAGDDWLGPVLDWFTLMTPIVFHEIPQAALLQSQRDQPRCRSITPSRLDYAGEIGTACIDPLLRGPNNHDLPGNQAPAPDGAERESWVAAQQAAARKLLFDR
jgi:hypothetical protein